MRRRSIRKSYDMFTLVIALRGESTLISYIGLRTPAAEKRLRVRCDGVSDDYFRNREFVVSARNEPRLRWRLDWLLAELKDGFGLR